MRFLIALAAATALLCAQEQVDLSTVHRIRTEAFDNSKLMDTLWYLTDVYGPRLTGSPEAREAAEWTMKRLREYGLENVHLESWGPAGRPWSLRHASLEMISPRYAGLTTAPLAWTRSTNGPVEAEAIYAPIGSGKPSFNPKKLESDIEEWKKTWKGKLKGKIVLVSRMQPVPPSDKVLFERY